MVYQYCFQEGLEMSLVPEQEAPPFGSGPKILELALTGFTGRLIINKQALQQYSLDNYGQVSIYHNNVEKSDINDDSSYEDAPETHTRERQRQQQQQQQQLPPRHPHPPTAAATRQQERPDTASVRSSLDPPSQHPPPPPRSRRQDPAAHSPYKHRPKSPPSLAIQRKKRPNPGPTSNPTIDELAQVFASPPTRKAQEDASIDDSGIEVLSVASSVSTRGAAARPRTRDEKLDEFASVFCIKSQKKVGENASVSIDDGSAEGRGSDASSQESDDNKYSRQRGESEQRRDRRKEEDIPDDPLSQFASAYVTKAGPGSKSGIDSIDSNSSASPAPSLASSSGSSASSVPYTKTDRRGQQQQQKQQSGAQQKVRKQQPADPLSEFVEAFGSASRTGVKVTDNTSLDEDSGPASSAYSIGHEDTSSYTDTSSAAYSSSVYKSQKQYSQPLDPLDEYTQVFVTPVNMDSSAKQQEERDMIDEESGPSNSDASINSENDRNITNHSGDTPTSQSDDPLSQFNRAYQQTSDDDAVGSHVMTRAPEPPQGSSGSGRDTMQQPPQPVQRVPKSPTKPKKRQPQQPKVKKLVKGGGGLVKPKMSADRKQKIRDLFPNYPDVSTGKQGSLDPVGVYLHRKCSASFENTLTQKDLRELLEVFPFAAYCADEKGRLPLHTLGENEELTREPQGRQRATLLAKTLIKAYPESVRYPDGQGYLPFVSVVYHWVEETYSTAVAEMKLEKEIPKGTEVSYDRVFPQSELLPSVEWCLDMLALVLDDMVGRGLLKAAPVEEQMEARRVYTINVLKTVPYLLKALLFLERANRIKMTKNAFVKRAVLCPESIGPWLQAMALRKGAPSKLAIDYFQLLAKTTSEDFVGPNRTPEGTDIETFMRERERVHRAIETMELTIPTFETKGG